MVWSDFDSRKLTINYQQMSQFMCKKGHLSHMQTAKAQASLRIRAVSPEPSLFAHTIQVYREVEEVSDKELEIWPL